MKKEEIISKLTALCSSTESFLKNPTHRYFDPKETLDLFERFNKIRDDLRASYKSLFEDMPTREAPILSKTTDFNGRGYIERNHFELLQVDINYCLKILAINIGEKNSKIPIDKDNLEKITIKDLSMILSRLTLRAVFFIFAIIGPILTGTYYLGYKVGISNSSVPTSSLENLNNYQISLLKEIYKYQRTTGVNKVTILRNGLIFDESTNKDTSINIAINVLGNRADQTRFEDLIISIPDYFLRRLPATRFNDPYVLTVTEEARKILDKKL